MKHQEPSHETKNETSLSFGVNPDDLSVLNEVLQQVKGISGVSTPAYELIEPSYSTDS